MPKLLEKNGAELFASLVNIAGPIGNLVNDEHLFSTIKSCVEKISKETSAIRTNNVAVLMRLFSEVAPILFGEAHLKDILQILAEIEGCTVPEMMNKNGADLFADALSAWKEQIGPFAKRAGLSGLKIL